MKGRRWTGTSSAELSHSTVGLEPTGVMIVIRRRRKDGSCNLLALPDPELGIAPRVRPNAVVRLPADSRKAWSFLSSLDMKLGPDSALRYSSVNVTTRVRLYVHIDSVNMFISAVDIIF